jgi:hypothetical protein
VIVLIRTEAFVVVGKKGNFFFYELTVELLLIKENVSLSLSQDMHASYDIEVGPSTPNNSLVFEISLPPSLTHSLTLCQSFSSKIQFHQKANDDNK